MCCDVKGSGSEVALSEQAPPFLSPRPDHSDVPVTVVAGSRCRVFLKIMLCAFKTTPPPHPLKQDLNVIFVECAFMPDYCVCSYEHPGVKNTQRMNVSVCAVYTKQFILSALHIFFIIAHTHRSASVKMPHVSLPGITRLGHQWLPRSLPRLPYYDFPSIILSLTLTLSVHLHQIETLVCATCVAHPEGMSGATVFFFFSRCN